MTFKDIDSRIKPSYNSINEDIIETFYIPVLKETKRYDRISAYFNSTSLALAAKGMSSFIKNNGHMRLLCGAQLSSEDLEMIENASDAKKLICQNFIKDLENIEDELINNHLKVLGWMIANDILEIKVGFNIKNQNKVAGILHSKMGMLWDFSDEIINDNDFNHCIVFEGSNNETASGWAYNIESFKVYKGWEDSKFITEDIINFSKMWNNENENLIVMDIPEANKKALINKAPENINEVDRLLLKNYKKNKDERELFKHQKGAIKAWFDNNKHGILEMATGTGKTFTALNCLKKLNDAEDNLVTVIACPYAHLATQWYNEVEKFNFDRVFNIFGSENKNWKNDLSKIVKRVNRGKYTNVIIVTTHNTFSSESFTNKIKDINSNLCLIADEMHHLGAEGYIKGLLNNYTYRLGLSATPKRFMDEETTNILFDYFGGVVSTFNIEDALYTINPKTNKSYLTPYNYIPEKIKLTESESTEYKNLSQKIGALMNNNKKEDEKSTLESLLRKRRKILNNAEEKYDKLREILRSYDNIDHLIVFCSDKQIDNVLNILKEENVSPRHRFTSKEKNSKTKELGGLSQREDLLNKFDRGVYKALVAMKCLDEGVDVPSADKVIIMSSTTNPIEYVQRRGRVLRRYPGKEIATIYDMTIVPDSDEKFADNIIMKERQRLDDFILTAENKEDCENKLRNWGVLN